MYKNTHTHILITRPYRSCPGDEKMKKIIIAILMLFLVIGIVSAVENPGLKPLKDYTDFDSNGQSNYTTNNQRYFFVEKVSELDDDFKEEWFQNHSDFHYVTYPVGDNIHYFEDGDFTFYGYQEIVEIDGTYYMISINQNSKLTPSEKTLYLNNIKEFNKLNNLTPIAV